MDEDFSNELYLKRVKSLLASYKRGYIIAKFFHLKGSIEYYKYGIIDVQKVLDSLGHIEEKLERRKLSFCSSSLHLKEKRE